MAAPRRSSMRTGAGDTEAVLITFFSVRKVAAGQTTRVGFPFHLQRGDPYGLSIRNRTRQESRKLCSAHDKRGTPMKELTHFVGGKHVSGASRRFVDGFEPMTGEVISRVPLASKAEVRGAAENAIAVQPSWAATNP